MRLELETCVLRSLEPGDADAIARHGNNRNVWINVRDQFPHPYQPSDARRFIERVAGSPTETVFAITVGDEAVGCIGIIRQPDVDRVSAEIGFWLGESHWGRGIATEAVRAVTEHVIEAYGLTRVYARVFEWNAASERVLEKAGYQMEGRLSRSAIKDGKVIDQFQYAYVLPAQTPEE